MARPRAPHPAEGASRNRRGGGPPGSLLVSVVSWLLVGITLLVSRLGAAPTNQNPVAPGVTSAIDTVGESVARTNQVWWWVPYVPVLGIVVILLVGLLLARQGWVRFVLVLLGLTAVIGFAQAGQWHIVPAAVFVVVGAAASVTPAAHRYLRGGAPTASDTGPAAG